MKKLIFILMGLVILGGVIIGGYFLLKSSELFVPPKGEFAVSIENSSFKPQKLVVKEGSVVIWTNNEDAEHRVTLDDPSGFQSEALKKGATFKHTFTQKGEYPYHCSLNPAIKGTVIVK
jgi:plastocyanin